jgi:hypothetical protein
VTSLALPGTDTSSVKVGMNAGWMLAFHTEDNFQIKEDKLLELSRDDYYGEIEASLPGGFEGGNYTFVIEGLSDDDYSKISLPRNATTKLVVRLYLYWRDVSSSVLGALTTAINIGDIVGSGDEDKHKKDLVAELRVVSVSRKAGQRKYETTIVARERVFDVAAVRPCGDPIDYTNPRTAADALMKRLHLESNSRFLEPVPNSKVPPEASSESQGNAPKRALDTHRPGSDLLGELATYMEQKSNLHGRGMLLIRKGVVYIGQRDIPFGTEDVAGKVKPLTLDNGLAEVEASSQVVADPNWDFCANPDKPQPMRQQYKLTLCGRPDLMPGDVVRFSPPAEDVKKAGGNVFGAIGDLVTSFIPGKMQDPVTMYVASVEHKLGRVAGFVTTAVGIEIKEDAEEDEKWDGWSAGRLQGTAGTTTEAAPEQQVSKAVTKAIKTIIERDYRFPDVGEIRTFAADNSSSDAPAQTETLWRGVVDGNGQTQPSYTAEILRPTRSVGHNVPYLTPFAWGKCGLVLPRFPGMRVLVEHRRGDGGDPIDVGAIWAKDHLPDDTQPGDWWLILPASGEAAKGNAPDPTAKGAPVDFSGSVSHDLIDVSGVRIIETDTFVVRAGTLVSASRPKIADDEKEAMHAITVEHKDSGALLRIDQNGKITLKGKSVEIDAETTITLKAQSVSVE